jgi:EAL domain-containing protein (putative c-di-GMP-specific phosphodiesterase class I)
MKAGSNCIPAALQSLNAPLDWLRSARANAHPERGELLPGVFLPAAEESGLMQPLGDWILREALSAATHWPPHLTLAINVSAAQLRQGDVASAILEALPAAGVDPSRLRIEIPECVLLDTSDAVHHQLRRLKASSASIVVDDFGLSTSSLQMLARSHATQSSWIAAL